MLHRSDKLHRQRDQVQQDLEISVTTAGKYGFSA